MGAWNTGNFDNDDAGDWVWTLERAEDISILEHALSEVTDEAGYLEAPNCSIALAAAEVVAAMHGKPTDRLPVGVQRYVERFREEFIDALIAKASSAVKKIGEKSELQELWDESESREEWHNVLADLSDRLK